MIRILLIFALIPSFAFAHNGLHHHPHGIEYGWIIAAAVGLVGGFALSRVRSAAKGNRK